MATEVKSWRANDGSLHDDKVTAAQRDVELLVTSIMWAGADVEHISEKLIENREHVIRVLTEYHRLAPPTVSKGEAPSGKDDGPVVIPSAVYFNFDQDNFYHAVSKEGMGVDFYKLWHDRWREFPATPEAALTQEPADAE